MRVTVRLMGIDENGNYTGSMYMTTKNTKSTTKRMEVKKYCKFTRKHILHRESKGK